MKRISALAVAGVFVASLAGTALAEGVDVKVSGEVRIRDEWKNNSGTSILTADFDSDAGESNKMITQRTRVNVDAKIDEKTSAYVSLENSRNWGSSGPAFANTAADSVGVYQGYVLLNNLFDQPLLFKAGRQKIALGNQRLVGANDWGAGQTFDGWILGYNTEPVAVNLFSVTGVDRNSTSHETNGMGNGIYATIKSIPVTGIDLYAIQLKDVSNFDENFITYGARVNGAAMNIDWDAEFALQSGDSDLDVKKKANALWLLAGYTLPEVAKLRIGAEYDMLSGSKYNALATDDDKAFNHLFPTKHAVSQQHSVYGITDLLEGALTAGHPGLQAYSVNVSAEPVDGLKLLAEYWNFSSAEDYAPGMTAIGSEMNLQVWYGISKSTSLHAYYAAFTPNSDLTETMSGAGAANDAATDAVLQLQVAF
jgi:hypothetical protein